MKKKRLRIVNKFRFTVFLVSIFLFVFTIIGTVIGINTVESAQVPKYIEICVRSGDTLWSLADEHGAQNVDKRKIIYEISTINNLDDSYIYPGQVLKVPVTSTEKLY